MKFRICFYSLLLVLLTLTGCTRLFDSVGYMTAMMDTLYKGDYTAYAAFTGISTAEISEYRSQWLANATDNFITVMGAGNPSDDMRERTAALLKKIYANARYELTVNEDNSIQLTIYPIDLIVSSYETLQTYVADFNKKNDAFAFTALTEQEFNDTYLDGILTILESRLAALSYQNPVQMTVTIYQDDDGLYTIDSKTLANIQKKVLVWPAKAESAEKPKNKS